MSSCFVYFSFSIKFLGTEKKIIEILNFREIFLLDLNTLGYQPTKYINLFMVYCMAYGCIPIIYIKQDNQYLTINFILKCILCLFQSIALVWEFLSC